MTDTKTALETNLILPTADDLDTGHYGQTSGRSLRLYLIPAEETEAGIPQVTTFERNGSGEPIPAWHRRWVYLWSVGAQTVGDSVLRHLECVTDRLVAISDEYLGSEWDGSNWIGQWSEQTPPAPLPEPDDLSHYWEAGEWFSPAGEGWPELSALAGVDPERALGEDWRAVVAQVAAIVEPLQDEAVSGTENYLTDCAEEWREEMKENIPQP